MTLKRWLPVRDTAPFRFALPDALTDYERRLAALERRAVPVIEDDEPVAAWEVRASGFSLASGGVGAAVQFTTYQAALSSVVVTPGAAMPLAAGVWWCEAWASFAANVTGIRVVFPQINGASSGRRAQIVATTGGVTTEVGVAFKVVVAAAATVGLVCAQTSGGALSTSARMSAVRVGAL